MAYNILDHILKVQFKISSSLVDVIFKPLGFSAIKEETEKSKSKKEQKNFALSWSNHLSSLNEIHTATDGRRVFMTFEIGTPDQICLELTTFLKMIRIAPLISAKVVI